jgi:hypothetical protein
MKRGRYKKKIIDQPTGLKSEAFDDLYDDTDVDWKNYGANSRNRHQKAFKK